MWLKDCRTMINVLILENSADWFLALDRATFLMMTLL